MAGYFQHPYQMDGGGEMLDLMDTSGMNGMNPPNLNQAQSLDDVVDGTTKAMRRSSIPMHYSNGGQQQLSDPRRASLMNFGNASPGSLDGFSYDHAKTSLDRSHTYPRPGNGMQDRRQSSNNLMLDTFSGDTSPFPQMPMDASGYASPMGGPNSAVDMNMNMASMLANSNMPVSLEMSDQALNAALANSNNSMMFAQDQFDSPIINSPVGPMFPDQSLHSTPHLQKSMTTPNQDHQGNLTPNIASSRTGSHDTGNGTRSTSHTDSIPKASRHASYQSSQHEYNNQSAAPQMPDLATGHGISQIKVPWETPAGGFPSTMHNRPHMQGQFKNAYSSTGFDMLDVLMRVATRPNPEINIGSVDLSCAFVVCDAEKDDNPIVYCSDNFERLTGYSRHEILGRNCRFLQSPDGRVEPGIKRKYVDDESVLYLKNMITTRKEAQISLINYRRGGQPFMNLLTMIPVGYDHSDRIKFFVGFQVDLVEQPSSVTNKNPDGSYSINYQRGLSMPRYIAPDQRSQLDLGQSISREEVSNVLSTFGTQGDSEFTRRMWDKILLENTDDVVHVLSLKGLFLYLSPSCRAILEYEANELVGTALSSVCHPSDIVPVTRELKDTSNNVSVNVVFRIRRKHSGYMWFEGHGTLHTEQGKGRKCIILVGRERPVYTLSQGDVREAGGIGENELWTKMSTSGMFLFVSSNVRQLLDRQPDELIGTSIQVLMRNDSKQEFGRILSLARTGRKASVKHEMMNKRGQTLQAFTTVYPGDANEGTKPTFLVAQTRMLKFSRGSSQRQALLAMTDQSSAISGYQPSPVPSTGQNAQTSSGQETPISRISASHFISSDGAAATCAGRDGLQIGSQDVKLAAEDNLFDELKTTRSTSWQYELRQMEKCNRLLAEEVQSLLAAKKKRKRRKGAGTLQKDCANCHTRVTPEWRRGPSGNRDLCNSCGLRWAKQQGRVSPRTSSQHSASDKGSKASASPRHTIKQDSSLSPKITSNLDSTVRMDTGGSHGHSSTLPIKIDEGIEPD